MGELHPKEKDALHLRDLVFHGFHGVHSAEAQLGQRFHLDVTCWLDLEEASVTDQLAHTVCYAGLVQIIEEVVTQRRYDLIERLAGAVCQEILEREGCIEGVRVHLRKPFAALALPTGCAAVEITRWRSSRLFSP